MTDQKTKGEAFRTLHESGCFIIPNPWDAGSAKLMTGLGFKALASTSSGYARSTGVNDYELSREQVIPTLQTCAQRQTCRYPLIWRTGLATPQKIAPRRSNWGLTRDSSEPRSKISTACQANSMSSV